VETVKLRQCLLPQKLLRLTKSVGTTAPDRVLAHLPPSNGGTVIADPDPGPEAVDVIGGDLEHLSVETDAGHALVRSVKDVVSMSECGRRNDDGGWSVNVSVSVNNVNVSASVNNVNVNCVNGNGNASVRENVNVNASVNVNVSGNANCASVNESVNVSWWSVNATMTDVGRESAASLEIV